MNVLKRKGQIVLDRALVEEIVLVAVDYPQNNLLQSVRQDLVMIFRQQFSSVMGL